MATTTQSIKIQTYNHLSTLQQQFSIILRYELEQCEDRILAAGGQIPDLTGSHSSSRNETKMPLAQRLEWVPV